MQILTTLAGSGTLGGVVGNRSPHGMRLSARTAHTQPRTPAQTMQRHRVGSMAGAWRALTPAEQGTWAAMGALITRTNSAGTRYTLTGYQAFVSLTTKALSQAAPLPVTAGTVTIEQQGTPIAETSGILYEQQGAAIAGSS
jgi:hypothetical protein